MSKRESESDFDGPASKMSRGDDQDDGGTSGRSGRVRKKSAKVLEMEEFEQVEKTQQTTKKGKTPKTSQADDLDGGSEKVKPVKKAKPTKGSDGDVTPVTSKKPKATSQLSKALQLAPLPVANVIKSESNVTEPMFKTIKLEAEVTQQQTANVSPPDQKSVIKYLLSSPTSATKLSSPATTSLITHLSPLETPPKKTPKKPKAEKSSLKVKVKKEKAETAPLAEEPPQGLKMKIFASSDPSSAQVTLSAQPKPKKVKKPKLEDPAVAGQSKIQNFEMSPPVSSTKKTAKKQLTKKEKLIQEAISAAKQMPSLTALVTSQSLSPAVQGQLAPALAKVAKKKKPKAKALIMNLESPTDELDQSELMDDEDDEDDDDEMNLIISETESKKKKTHSKKKGSASKEKSDSLTPKGDKLDEKLAKRAPTAYMLFCNTHRPTIVNENPGIEFAAISRKLGEMWQTLSNKQKLQWRRKAQRRRKKSNLISTGKAGRESLPMTIASSVSATPVSKIPALIHKAQRLSPEEVPLSPTKAGDQNLSIEPIDVAAHLKLLGESLSIIGMRLQEHKGMIAVQGSLSVLLDSLICACGPLLCLSQQVPGMDGCSPAIHSQTLDSVAYVMPGL